MNDTQKAISGHERHSEGNQRPWTTLRKQSAAMNDTQKAL